MTPFTARHFRKYVDHFPPQHWLNLYNTDGTPEEHRHEAWRIEATPAGLISLPVYDTDALLARIPRTITIPVTVRIIRRASEDDEDIYIQGDRTFSFVEIRRADNLHAALYERQRQPDDGEGTQLIAPVFSADDVLSRERDDTLAKIVLALKEEGLITL